MKRVNKTMRIKDGEYIYEVDKVCVREDDIQIGLNFFQTKKQTQQIGRQLLENGYADLTNFSRV